MIVNATADRKLYAYFSTASCTAFVAEPSDIAPVEIFICNGYLIQ